MAPFATLELTGTLTVESWVDPVVDRLGHDPRSGYGERFWLPVLGPSTLFLLRHLVAQLEASPEGCTVAIPETARALGLGERLGRNGPFARTLQRAADFEMARLHGSVVAVRRRLPPLPRRHLARLPASARAAHEALVRQQSAASVDPAPRARQLALSLARLGEDAEAVERQLLRWRFDGELAGAAAAWAAAIADSAHPSVAPLPARDAAAEATR